jgi:hypothetical protein
MLREFGIIIVIFKWKKMLFKPFSKDEKERIALHAVWTKVFNMGSDELVDGLAYTPSALSLSETRACGKLPQTMVYRSKHVSV